MNKFLTISLVSLSLFSLSATLTNNATFSGKSAQKSPQLSEKSEVVDVNEKIVLRIKNMEDYIYTTEDDSDAFIHQFEAYADTMGYHNVDVVYSTTDTNETLYSQLLTGKSNYDLICPSEYMIQKMIRENLVVKLDKRDTLLPNYDAYASSYIRNRFDSIVVSDANGDPLKNTDDSNVTLGEYGVGYMWGTLGLLFNPYYAHYDTGKAIDDAQHWDMLWNTDYNGTISIKDSMRDTYAMAVLQLYKDELAGYRSSYENSEITAEEYNKDISDVFNRCDTDTIKDVEKLLGTLRGNIFGLEVDSGKSDIVSGKIGINLAWSGDAVYSMELGEEENKELCYSIPLDGSNLWFDGWVMPKCTRSALQEEVAYLFLDFLSTPEYARENMEYTGYTSFIGGDDIRDLVRDWYDVRTDEIYVSLTDEEYADIYAINPSDDTDSFVITYDDLLTASHDSGKDSYQLVYFTAGDGGGDVSHHVSVLSEDGEPTDVDKTYGDLTIVDDPDSGLEAVDLNYFFNNSFGTDTYVADSSYVFYSDSYFYSYTDSENVEHSNISVGRQFFCQYPDFETIVRCAVMKDFAGESNEAVLAMWERFKSTSLPLWASILFVIEIVIAFGVIGYMVINKKLKYQLRQKRKKLNAEK